MMGAIAGDIIGSVHEIAGTKTKDFPLFGPEHRFTDDTVLTVAVAEWLMDDTDLVETLQRYVYRYPEAGYGGSFMHWAFAGSIEPYNSWGNGSAMRVSPVAWACDSLEDVLRLAEQSAAVTHNHPEGIRGAQAAAAAMFLARTCHEPEAIQEYIEQTFGYDLSTPLDDIRPRYCFDVSCQGSVPQSIRAFLEADSYEETVRNAISLGGDADTMACIAGGIAQARWGLPDDVRTCALMRLDDHLTSVVERFEHWCEQRRMES